MPTFIRAQVLLAGGIGIVLAGCGSEEVRSDLNTEGPPRVLVVTVPSEAEGGAAVPTYCAQQIDGPYGAEKLHAMCLDPMTSQPVSVTSVADVSPEGWEVRVAFNELLDADQVEEIVEIPGETDQYGEPRKRGTLVNTQPVALRCGGADVSYDGYYDPSGSHLTDPPGPALIVTLADPVSDFVGTGTDCEIEVNADIRDKAGNSMLASARGPFSFTFSPLLVAGSDPNDGDEGVAVGVQPTVLFNARIDPATLTDAEGAPRITLSNEAGDLIDATLSMKEGDPTTVVLEPAASLELETTYTLSVSAGIADPQGGALSIASDPLDVATFTTGDMAGPDAGPGVDAAPVDAGPIDAAPIDAGPIDAAPIDAAPIDAAPIDAA